MARNSIFGSSHSEEIQKLSRSIIGNAGHITESDLKVLRFLAYKGSFEKQKVKLVPNGE